MFTLRPYQTDAVRAIYAHARTRDDNPCCVLPTGAGKTAIIAKICEDTVSNGGRILVLSHVKELLEQAASHLKSFLPGEVVGLHSAGLGRRDIDQPVIVAGIQTVANIADKLGPFQAIIVDECHLIPERGEGRYLTFLRDAKVVNPKVRIIGLTATPYRLGSGLLCKPENMLNHVCYDANVKELIIDGWLCPLRTRRGIECANLSDVKIASTGDFASDEMQAAFESIIKPACAELAGLCVDRHSVLIFAAGVEHCRMVADILGGEVVIGSTPKEERASIIERFRDGGIKYLVNVNVLTTGFDAPNVDAVVLLRATLSPGLYCQMVGRGLRKHPSKTDCLVLDYGDNAVRHGPIDRIEVVDKKPGKKAPDETPGKECPNCHEVIAVQYRICPKCDYEFPVDYSQRHNREASDAPILSEESEMYERQVLGVKYSINTKQKDTGPSVTLRVEYLINEFTQEVIREFLCFDHPPFSKARKRAEQWWKERTDVPVPDTVMDACALAVQGALAEPRSITYTYPNGQQWPEPIAMDLSERPEWCGLAEDCDFFTESPEPAVSVNDMPF